MNVRHLFKLLATVYMMAAVSPSLAQVVGDGDITVYPSDISARAQIFKVGFPTADNRVIRSDGILGHVQGSDVELKDGGSMVFPVGTYIQVPSIKGGVASSVSATYGVTLPTGAFIQSGDTADDSIAFRIANTNHGLGYDSGTVNGPAIFFSGNQQWGWNTTAYYPMANGTKNIGSTVLAVNDTYSDDIYLQLTTPASEGKLHWEGAAGDSSMAIVPVKADGTAPTVAGDAVALAVKLAASPGSGESVEVTRFTSASGIILNAAGIGRWLTDSTDATDFLQWASAATPWGFYANNAPVCAFGTSGTFNYKQIYVDYSGTGSETKLYLSNVAGSTGSSIQSRKADGTDATPYDSVSVFLPGSPTLPSSVEALRVTSGQVLVGTIGSSSAPSYSFTGDPDTGVYSVGPNRVAIGASGAIRAEFGTSFNGSWQEWNLDASGTGTQAELNFSGSASNSSAAKIEMSDASGAAAAPYDSFSFKLSNMGAPSSIEAMRVTSSQILAGVAGTAAVPSISWAGDTDTGFYLSGAAVYGATGGALRSVLGSSGIGSYQYIMVDVAGTGSQSGYNFAGAAGSSVTAPAASIQMCKADGTLAAPYDSMQVMLSNMGAPSSIEAMRITSSQILAGVAGTAVAPSISWAGDPNTGIYNLADAILFASGGVARSYVNNGGFKSIHTIQVDDGGTGSEADYAFSGIAGNSTAKIEMSDVAGAAAAPYDSISFKLPADPGSGASVEAMRVTSGGIIFPAITAPDAPAAGARLYLDVADGNLKVRFADGDIVTIATNP